MIYCFFLPNNESIEKGLYILVKLYKNAVGIKLTAFS